MKRIKRKEKCEKIKSKDRDEKEKKTKLFLKTTEYWPKRLPHKNM